MTTPHWMDVSRKVLRAYVAPWILRGVDPDELRLVLRILATGVAWWALAAGARSVIVLTGLEGAWRGLVLAPVLVLCFFATRHFLGRRSDGGRS